MSFDKKSLCTDSDEDFISDDSYLTSVLKVVNGFCKINLEVQLMNSFYSEGSLLPINAKINNNNMQQKSMNTDILKNDENIENILQSNLLINTSNDEFKIYSKPSYSASVLNNDKKPNLVPRGKKKITSNTIDSEPCGFNSLYTIQNVFKDYNINQDDNEGLQKQELQSKQMSKNFKNLSILDQGSDIAIQNENSSKHSECPLCFKLYRSQDIEAHASGCSI